MDRFNIWDEDDSGDFGSGLSDAEAQGAHSLKFEAIERCDIKTALEFQKIEQKALMRIHSDEPDSADNWKDQNMDKSFH